MPKSSRGITLVEIMITLVIVIVLLVIGIVTMRGYLPKQHLLTSVTTVENILRRTQMEASSRAAWTCVAFTATGVKAFADIASPSDHGATSTCGDSSKGYLPLAGTDFAREATFRGRTTIAACSVPKAGQNLWFDATGQAFLCSSGSCTASDAQIILANPDLATGARSREVEVTQGGLIQLVKPGQKGLITSKCAKIAPFETDSCACEE
jgi:Tfp pilus assembly protein FimT